MAGPDILERIRRIETRLSFLEGVGEQQGAPGDADTLDGQHATAFLWADGSQQLAGNLSVADGKTIDGVDISAHASRHAVGGADALSDTVSRATVTSLFSTSSSTYVDVTGLSVTFTPTATENALVFVSAVIGNDSQYGVTMLRVLCDGSSLDPPGDNNIQSFANYTDHKITVAWVFRVSSLSATSHTIKVQIRKNAGTTAKLWKAELVVQRWPA